MNELKITLPYFNDPWMDNAVVNLYGLLMEVKKRMKTPLKLTIEPERMEACVSEVNIDAFEEQLWEEITRHRDNVVFVEKKDKETGGLRKVRKDFVLIGYDGDRSAPIHHRLRDFYSEAKGKELLHDALQDLQTEESERNHTCVLCGQRFHRHKPKPLTNLKQAIHPYATKNKALGGVRSDKERKGIRTLVLQENFKDVCPSCYLAGIMAWADESLIFRSMPDYAFVLLPVSMDFLALQEIRRNYSNIVITSNRYSSLRVEPLETKKTSSEDDQVDFPPGPWSMLFGATEKFAQWAVLKLKDGLGEGYEKACNTWLALRIPSGTVKDVKSNQLNIEDLPRRTLNILITKKTNPYKDFLGQLYVIVERGGRSVFDNDGLNRKREALSKAFLTNDFNAFAKEFVPRERKRIVLKKEARDVLEKLLQEWRLKKMKLEEEHLDILRSAGNLIAETATKSIGLIYRLDRSRTLPEFWDNLREISRKMIGLEKPVKSTSLDGVIKLMQAHQKDWEEIKNLLLIYTCMYYSIKTYTPSKGGEK